MGFRHNLVHSDSFNIIAKSVNRPVLPRIREQYEDIPGRDGSYDLSDGTLEDNIIEIRCTFTAEDIFALRILQRDIAAWLFTTEKVELVFDDEPDLFYMAKVTNQIDLPEAPGYGEFTVQFRCDPHAYTGPTTFDQVNNYDSGLYYPNPPGFTWEFTTHRSGLYNYGQATWLNITIVDAVTDPSITNDNTLETIVLPSLSIGQTMFIDGENLDVFIDGVSVLAQVSGDFITLQAGDNGLIFRGTSPNATVTYEWEQPLL